MKKATREWEQKYYEEKSKSIKILKNPSFKVINESGSSALKPEYKVKEKVVNHGK